MARQPKTPRMLTHGQIWTALDRLAERSGLSPSGLAKSAGLDPTTFNKSKRITSDGRERWPSTSDEHAYALEISGDQMNPAYRDGDVIVVSPGTPIRRGDRVVVKTRVGEVMIRELKRRTAKTLELQSLNPNHADRALAAGDVL